MLFICRKLIYSYIEIHSPGQEHNIAIHVALTGRTMLTRHKNIKYKKTRSANSQLFGLFSRLLATLKIFSFCMPTLDTKWVNRKKLTLA